MQHSANLAAGRRRALPPRGRPMITLVAVLSGWLVLRLFLFEAPLEPIVLQVLPPALVNPVDPFAVPYPVERSEAQQDRQYWQDAPAWHLPPVAEAVKRLLARDDLSAGEQAELPAGSGGGGAAARGMTPAEAIKHAILVGAGYFDERGAAGALARRGPAAFAKPPAQRNAGAGRTPPILVPLHAEKFAESASERRWRIDGWALSRNGSSGPATPTRPSYGRSQIGAVLSYRLGEASGHRPRAQLRASAALDGAREREAALGASARPFARVPVRLFAEARLTDTARGTESRAAVFAVSEFPPVDLPGRTIGEAYLQTGYVTGDFGTLFVDGQARITRDVAQGRNVRLSVGGGAWGGAQEGVERLDIGPSARLGLRLGEANAQITADYRFRVAGDGAPSSGPAVTIAAGF